MVVIIYHHQDHLELAEALAHCLKRQQGVLEVELKTKLDRADYNRLHIFVDLHHFVNVPLSQMPPKYIMYNYQQLPYGRKHKFEMVLDKAQKALAIWDYSEMNQQLIQQEFNLPVSLAPFGYSETFERPLQYQIEQKIDVVFVGELSPRRKDMLMKLSAMGYQVVAPARVDGIAKMELIRQGKILLNMHKREADGILETGRLAFYLANGAFVISERSSDQRAMETFENKIVYAPSTAHIPDLVGFYLSRPYLRAEIAERAYHWITHEYHYANLLPDIRSFL